MQFNSAIVLHFEYDYGYGIMSNLILHSYLSQSYDDDSEKNMSYKPNKIYILMDFSCNLSDSCIDRL